MHVLRRYRLASLAALLVGVGSLFLAFFFVFVLAPIAVLGIFYIVFLVLEERRRRAERRDPRIELLAREDEARRSDAPRRPAPVGREP